MSMQPVRLSMYEALTGIGIEPDAAHKFDLDVDSVLHASHGDLMTKADGQQIRAEVAAVKTDLAAVKSDLSGVKADIAAVKVEIGRLEARQEASLHKAMNEQTWKLMGFMLALATALFALFRLLPAS